MRILSFVCFAGLVAMCMQCTGTVRRPKRDPPKFTIPTELQEFYESLTDEDWEILDREELRTEIEGISGNETADEIIAAISRKSDTLGAKCTALRDTFKGKVEALEEVEAQEFMTNLLRDEVKYQLVNFGGSPPTQDDLVEIRSSYWDIYQELPEAAKKDIKTQFPDVNKLFKKVARI